MSPANKITRRQIIKSSLLGTVAIPASALIASSKEEPGVIADQPNFPSIEIDVARQVVLYSHFNLEKVKELVNERPELARASYDWAFGDWESAIGAASHVGRLDIIEYLLNKGARPTLFAHTAMGQTEVVKAIVAANPGIQQTLGPHGISLLQHAKISARSKDRSATRQQRLGELINYLEELGDADGPTNYLEAEPEALKIYEGDYMYGDGEKDGVSIKLNSRDMIALGRLGTFGGGLNKIAEHRFVYNGTPSTEVSFEVKEGSCVALQIHEPTGTIKAIKKLKAR